MAKRERLQLRMASPLKAWFERYAEPRGGMSRIVHGHVEELYARETGRSWKRDEEDEDGQRTPEDEDGHGDGGAAPAAEHRPRLP